MGADAARRVHKAILLMFRSLHIRARDIYSGLYQKSEENSIYLADAVRLQKYSLASAPFYIQRVPLIGYVGYIQFELPVDMDQLRHVQTLLGISEYTGIGAKTAIGMGGVKVFWGGSVSRPAL